VTGQPYSDVYNQIRGDAARQQAEHPVASAAGGVAGSLVGTVPVARAVPWAFGGSTMLGQTGVGGITGATDAYVRSGGDPTAMKVGGAVGAAGPVLGSILNPIGQAAVSAGRWVNDRLPNAIRPLAPKILPAPQEEIANAADAGYKALAKTSPFDPQAVQTLKQGIKDDLRNNYSRSDKVGAVETHQILDTLDSLPATPGALHTVRKALGKISGGDEGHSAGVARDAIDQFLSRPPPGALLYGNGQALAIPGQPQARTAGEMLQDANANYRAASTSSELRDRVAAAQLTAKQKNPLLPYLDEGGEVRDVLRNWTKSDKASRFMKPDERAAVEGVTTAPSIGEGALRIAGTLSGTAKPSLMSLVAPLATGTLGGGIVPMALGAGAGVASNAASTALTRRAVNTADNIIRANAPYSQAYMAGQLPPPTSMSVPFGTGPSSISTKAYRDEVARTAAQIGVQQAGHPLPPVTIDYEDQ
jgi:hypothetical protein